MIHLKRLLFGFCFIIFILMCFLVLLFPLIGIYFGYPVLGFIIWVLMWCYIFGVIHDETDYKEQHDPKCVVDPETLRFKRAVSAGEEYVICGGCLNKINSVVTNE